MITIADVTQFVAESLQGAEWEFFAEKQEAVNDANRILAKVPLIDVDAEALKEATILVTLDLIRGITQQTQLEDARVKSTAFAGLRTTYTEENRPNVEAGITSLEAWNLLKPYLDCSAGISLYRV